MGSRRRTTHIKMNDKKSNQVVKKETTKVEPKKMKKFIVKKKEEPPPKKMKKFIVKKKEPVSELKRIAGLTKEQANKMNPEELFGKLPVELRKMVLDPKITGIKVAKQLTPEELIDLDDIVNKLIGCEFYYNTF